MLYDKRWDKKIETRDPFTLESLIAWLEKQPTAKRYDYVDSEGCMLVQYFTAMGFEDVSLDCGGFGHSRDGGDDQEYPAIMARLASAYPWTFGAALGRARAALSAERSPVAQNPSNEEGVVP